MFASNGGYEFPDEFLAVDRHEPSVLGHHSEVTYGGVWDYPDLEARALI